MSPTFNGSLFGGFRDAALAIQESASTGPGGFSPVGWTLFWSYSLFVFLLAGAVILLVLNIVRRNRAERRLDAQTSLMGTLIEAMPNPVFHKDANGVYLGCNKAFEEYFTVSREAVIGKTVFDLLPAERAQELDEMDRAVLASGGRQEREWRGEIGAGPVTALFSKAAFRGADGRVAGIVGVVTDLTRLKHAERALKESEERYALAQRAANDGIWDWDLRLGVVYFSDRWKEILGYAPSEMGNEVEEWKSRIHPDDLERVFEANGRCIRGEAPTFEVEYRLLHKDGGYRWILGRGASQKDRAGAVVRMAGTHTDLTRRKQAEEALRASEQKYRTLLEGMQEGYAGVDLEGRVLECNKAFSDMLGYSEQELKGMSFLDFTPPKWHALEAEAAARVMERGYSEVFEKQYRRKDGTVFPVELRIYATRDASGRPAGMWAMVSDVTERKRMQEAMIQNEKMMSVGGLAAGMAHEINNPLGGILQSSQVALSRLRGMYRADQDAARAAGCTMEGLHTFLDSRGIFMLLDGIRESAARAARIVSNMLEFSGRSESGKVSCDVGKLLDTALELAANDFDMKKRYDFKGVEVVRSVAPGLPPVLCTPTQIEQVVVNILRNAAQAMAGREGVKGRILVSASREDGFVRIEIEDNGPGMDESVRKRAFEPFFTTKRPGEGTGLGLSVSYYIVTTNHDGSLDVQSRSGEGARFVIRLPAVLPDGRLPERK